MTKKKGLFGIFKSLGTHSEEDQKQRDFAKEQEEKETKAPEKSGNNTDEDKGSDRDRSASRRQGPRTEATEEMSDYAKTQLELILEKAEYSGNISSKKATHQISLEIKDSDDSGRIIGRDGSHINALQTLIRAMLFQKFGESPRVSIDNKNYQEKRLSGLRNRVLKSIDDLNENQTKVELEPMSATERREVHMLLKSRSDLNCYSNGEGRERHIVVEKIGNVD